MDDGAGGVPELEEFPVVVKGAFKLPGDEAVSPVAIDLLEGGEIVDYENFLTGCQGEDGARGKVKIDSISEGDIAERQPGITEIFEFNKLIGTVIGQGVTEVIGIEHDLADGKINGARWDFVHQVFRFQGSAPARADGDTCSRVVASTWIRDSGEQARSFIQRNGSGVLDTAGSARLDLLLACHEPGLNEEVTARAVAIKAMDGEDILAGLQDAKEGIGPEIHKGDRHAIIVILGCGRIPRRGAGRVSGGNLCAIEVGDEPVVIAHLERHIIEGSEITGIDIKGDADVGAGVDPGHDGIGGLEVDVDVGIISGAAVEPDAVGAADPGSVVVGLIVATPSGAGRAGRDDGLGRRSNLDEGLGTENRGIAGEAGIRPVEGVPDGAAITEVAGKSEGRSRRQGAVAEVGGGLGDELPVHPIEACREPVPEVVDLPRVSPKAGLIGESLKVANLGLVKFGSVIVDDLLHVGGGPGPLAEFEVAVDVKLPKILVAEEFVPPGKSEVGGASGPGRRTVVTAIGRIHGAVEVPDGAKLHFALAGLVEIGAQPQGIGIESENIVQVVIRPGQRIDVVLVVVSAQRIVHGIEVIAEPVGLLRGDVFLFWVDPAEGSSARAQPTVTRIETVDFHDVSTRNSRLAGDAFGQPLDVNAILVARDLFHEGIHSVVIKGAACAVAKVAAVGVKKELHKPGADGIAARLIAQVVNQGVPHQRRVKLGTGVEDPVGLLRHSQGSDILVPVVFVPGLYAVCFLLESSGRGSPGFVAAPGAQGIWLIQGGDPGVGVGLEKGEKDVGLSIACAGPTTELLHHHNWNIGGERCCTGSEFDVTLLGDRTRRQALIVGAGANDPG